MPAVLFPRVLWVLSDWRVLLAELDVKVLSEVEVGRGLLPSLPGDQPGVPIISSVGFVKDEVHMDVTMVKEEPRDDTVLMDNGLPLPRPEENDDHVHDDVFGDANEDVLMGDELAEPGAAPVEAPGDDMNVSSEHLNDDNAGEDGGLGALDDMDDGEEGEEQVGVHKGMAQAASTSQYIYGYCFTSVDTRRHTLVTCVRGLVTRQRSMSGDFKTRIAEMICLNFTVIFLLCSYLISFQLRRCTRCYFFS